VAEDVPKRMSAINRKSKVRVMTIAISCTFLILLSLTTFIQQIPAIPNTSKIYDRKFIDALSKIANDIPKNETLVATQSYPQVRYFTDHKVEHLAVPWVLSERGLVEFMWKVNASYLLVNEDLSGLQPDYTPLLIRLIEKSYQGIFDYYDKYISESKPINTQLTLQRAIYGMHFEELFEEISDYYTEYEVLHLYRLRSNVTPDSLSMIIGTEEPDLFDPFPPNSTGVTSKFVLPGPNIINTPKDSDSIIDHIKIAIDVLLIQWINSKTSDDWPTSSLSNTATSEGALRIGDRATTGNADNESFYPVQLIFK
jgi:hypothetical protein